MVTIVVRISMLMKRDIDETRLRIHQWLRAPDPSINHDSARMKSQAGTGSWLIQDARYAAWKFNSATFLWIHGIRRYYIDKLCPLMFTNLVLKLAMGKPYYGTYKQSL